MTWFDRATVSLLPLVPRALVGRLSRRYIAGETRQDALEMGRRLQEGGYRVTYDVLGEAVRDPAGVAAAAREYSLLLAELVTRGLERNISIKPTQMGLLLDRELVLGTMREICGEAREAGAFVRWEMEDSPTAEATLEVFARLRQEYLGTVGCVLQSRLRRAEEDAHRLLQEGDALNVRLVKGVYLEPPEIAWTTPDDINAAYLRILRLLLEGGAFVGVATHDDRLLRALDGLLAEQPAWREQVEVQMLLGVRERLRSQVRDSGLPVRVYVPYGSQWLPYVRRRLRENPTLARHALLGILAGRERLPD